MIYLTESEINSYTSIPNVTMNEVNYASLLVDTYIGDISARQIVETVDLNRKNKGKLKNIKSNVPLVSIDEVNAITRNPFDPTPQYEPLNANSIDVDNLGYFQFYGYSTSNTRIFNLNISKLQIKYTVGFEEAPEELKICVGAIASNAKKRGIGGNEKTVSDLDVRLEFLNDSLINSDIRQILNKYR